MGKGGIFLVFWGFVFGYVPFCFASSMMVGIFRSVKERRDFCCCVSQDVKMWDFGGFYFEGLQ